jgi:hypothetical protein
LLYQFGFDIVTLCFEIYLLILVSLLYQLALIFVTPYF